MACDEISSSRQGLEKGPFSKPRLDTIFTDSWDEDHQLRNYLVSLSNTSEARGKVRGSLMGGEHDPNARGSARQWWCQQYAVAARIGSLGQVSDVEFLPQTFAVTRCLKSARMIPWLSQKDSCLHISRVQLYLQTTCHRQYRCEKKNVIAFSVLTSKFGQWVCHYAGTLWDSRHFPDRCHKLTARSTCFSNKRLPDRTSPPLSLTNTFEVGG